MTTKDAIDAVIRDHGETERSLLPKWLRDPDPDNEEQFNLAFALVLHQRRSGAQPTYDENDVLTGWRGIKVKK